MIILITILAALACIFYYYRNLVPKAFVYLTNKEMTRRTNIENCSNPIGFNNESKVFCDQTTPNQPWAGLLMKDLSNKNQFIEIFINVIISNRAQQYLCKNILILIELS